LLKKSTWSENLILTLGKEEKGCVDKLNEEYYGDEYFRKHVYVLPINRCIRSSLFISQENEIPDVGYQPGDFLVDFEGWKKTIIPWLISMYQKSKGISVDKEQQDELLEGRVKTSQGRGLQITWEVSSGIIIKPRGGKKVVKPEP
jgi:hypothetical protein